MAIYMPPWLDRKSKYGPKLKASRRERLAQILTIGVLVGIVGLLVAVVTAILTSS